MDKQRITSLKSTPIKVRPVSQEHSCASVDDYVKMDVKEYLSQGVSLDELIKTVFNFDNDSYENFKTRANSWLTTSQGQTTFADLSAAYREELEQGVQEPALYSPFSNMGEFILTNAMTASSTPQKRRVKLAFTYNKLLEGKKPDFCIVPEKSDFSSSAKANQSTGEPVTRCYVNSATNNAAVASVASTTSAASSSTFAEDSATLNSSGGANVGTSNPQTTGEGNGGSSGAIKDEEWKLVLAPLEIKMFRSSDARKLSRKKSAKQPPTKRAKTDNSKDVSSPKTASASATSEEPLIRLDDVFSEQTQSATSLQEDIGKQTKSKGVTNSLVQFANYAIKVLSCRGDRSFALVPVVTEQFISVTYYSREGFAESQKVDFLENPVMLAAVLGLFVEFSSDLPRLGFNKKMGHLDPFEPDSTTTLRSNMQFTAITKADGGNDQDNQPDLNQLQLGEHITTQVGAIGRGTSVYRLENTRFKMKLVAKHSYQVKGRRYEHDIIRAARRVDPVHVPEIFGYAIEGSDQILKTLRDACPFKSAKYEEREFRVLVMREYTTISELGINEEFLHAIAQIMTCIHALNKKDILHRDISIYNIMFYRDKCGKVVAVLIDYDLATMPPFDKDPTSKHRTGTAPFMAYELLYLDSNATYQHGLHHDLESCFYCVIWHGVGYKTNKKFTKLKMMQTMPLLPKADVLRDWRVGAWKNIASSKYSFVTETNRSRNALEQICSTNMAYGTACARMIIGPLRKNLLTHNDWLWSIEWNTTPPPPLVRLTFSELMDVLCLEGYHVAPCTDPCCSNNAE